MEGVSARPNHIESLRKRDSCNVSQHTFYTEDEDILVIVHGAHNWFSSLMGNSPIQRLRNQVSSTLGTFQTRVHFTHAGQRCITFIIGLQNER